MNAQYLPQLVSLLECVGSRVSKINYTGMKHSSSTHLQWFIHSN